MPPHLIILASTSPRRKDLLSLLGIPFQVVQPASDESALPEERPVEHVRRLASEKARSVAQHYPMSLVIGSDTVIDLDGEILGKPADLQEARSMLTRLRGRSHVVHTGVALVGEAKGIEHTAVESVTVWITNFSDEVLEAYLQTRDSLGKAGAYSIQGEGAHLIQKIEGDYPAVVGLPLRQTAKLLEQAGVDLPNPVKAIYQAKLYANWKDFE